MLKLQMLRSEAHGANFFAGGGSAGNMDFDILRRRLYKLLKSELGLLKKSTVG